MPGPLYWAIHGIFCFLLVMFLPATIIYFLEDDFSYLDSVYFMMVTFSTVGFGDLTITNSDYKFVIMAFNYVG